MSLELLQKACKAMDRRRELIMSHGDRAEIGRLTDECNGYLVQMGKEPYLGWGEA